MTSATRSKSPSGVALRQRGGSAAAAVFDEGINPYDRPPISAKYDQMILERRNALVASLQTKLSTEGGAPVTVAFVEEMADGKQICDKFRVMCTVNGGLRQRHIELLTEIGGRILRLNGSNSIVYLLVNHDHYDDRPLPGFDLFWAQFFALGLLVAASGLFALVATSRYFDPE